MKPFTSIEEAKAELRDLPTEGLQMLQELTQEAFDADLISDAQYEFVMSVIVEEALNRMERALKSIFSGDAAERAGAPEGETVH
jgi:hypothetical protein